MAPTFQENDKLNLKSFAGTLETFLKVEHDFVDGALVVSLNAPFGSGKTTFLSMWKSDLDHRRETSSETPMTILLNAWESDYCGDPLIAVVTALIQACNSRTSHVSPSDKNRLREAALDVAWFSLGLTNEVVEKLVGVDVIAAGQFAKEKKDERKSEKPDFLTLYEKRTEALAELKSTLHTIFAGDKPKALVFVDELDRCRPDYAINYLETIKHVFDVHGLVFILAVDHEQLRCSAQALFGDLDFNNYFRKFAQRNLSLPEPNKESLRNLAQHYAENFIEKEGKRVSLLSLQYVDPIVEVIMALKLNPRQIQETFRIIGHVTAIEKEENKGARGRILNCLGSGIIFMAALKVANSPKYHSIGRNIESHVEIGKFLIQLLGKKADWWFRVYISDAWEGDEKNILLSASYLKN